MKSRRILLFALFTCVFALYGCVSSVSESASQRSLTVNIDKMTLKNVSDNSMLLPIRKDSVQKEDIMRVINGTYNDQPRVRNLGGQLSTKIAMEQVAKDYKKQVREKQKKLEEEKKKAEALKKQKEEEEASTFVGKLTTYGVDCYGCSFSNGRGSTATGIALDMYQGVQQVDGSFQPGIKYGNYYVVAADPGIPMYSILKISNHGLSGSGISLDEPFYAIVLDRGGAIYGGHLDLYIGSESSGAVQHVLQTTPKVQIVRSGA